MTSAQMESVRKQPACLECQARNKDPFTRENWSFFAIGNAVDCDNCLMILQIRFGCVDISQERK